MKVFFDTVGCRLNQSEIERMARQFRAVGHSVVGSAAEADLVVVNTCSVTSQAASDSRQKLRQAARLSPSAQILATGCWATLEPDETASIVDRIKVIPNDQKDQLTAAVLNLDLNSMDISLIERETLPGVRHRTRAFIKVQDGCDAFCTFCVTRIARGRSRSEPVEQILADIQAAIHNETKEIVLSGVQLGSWGKHLTPVSDLTHLVKTILRETSIPRIRFSSIEPWDIDEKFFGLFDDTRVCRHLHISLQSGCEATLKRMGRKTSPEEFSQILQLARSIDDDFSITTDVITGFPGETLAEFEESLDFIRQAGFSGGHVFPYSARKGTPAATMPGQVQSKERKVRAARVRDVISSTAQDYGRRLIGKTGNVLWEIARQENTGFRLEGLTEGFIRATAFSDKNLANTISPVQFTGPGDQSLRVKILPS